MIKILERLKYKFRFWNIIKRNTSNNYVKFSVKEIVLIDSDPSKTHINDYLFKQLKKLVSDISREDIKYLTRGALYVYSWDSNSNMKDIYISSCKIKYSKLCKYIENKRK